jgi:mannan endo-1,4-beta-mannosidase
MYDIILGYSAPYGSKIHNLYINGVDQGQISCTSEEWTETKLCSAKLTAGENEIGIKSSWGWTNLDYLMVEKSVLPDITTFDRTLSDSKATESAQRLMNYLGDNYGSHVLSGQQEIYKYGPHDFEYEFNYINTTTGEYPAIRGFDYLNCNPLYGNDDGTTDRIIQWVNNNQYGNNGIATASWHINVPVDFTNYTLGDKVDWSQSTYKVWKDGTNNTVPATDFDTSNAVIEGTKEYEYYMLCLEGLAAELKKLQDADVPLIFRPLHEAEGGGGETGSWFWWGQDGSAVYKQLWVLTYKTLTETYGLHNLIWEWNSYAYETSADWYPGDEYVDLIAYDKYNCTDWSTGQAVLTHNDSAISGTFYSIVEKYNGKKMVAMSENDSIPTLQNMLEEKAAWLYFCPWYDGGSDSINFLSNPIFNDPEDLKEMYQSDYCITLDELPDLKTYESSEKPTEPETTEPTEPETTEPPVTTTEAIETEVTTVTTVTDVTETDVTTPSSTSVTTVVSTDEPDVTTTTTELAEILVPEGVEATKYGDVNTDGKIMVSDIVSLNMFLLSPEKNPLSDVQIANSDCVRNGIVNTADSGMILNFVTMMVSEDQLGKAE